MKGQSFLLQGTPWLGEVDHLAGRSLETPKESSENL